MNTQALIDEVRGLLAYLETCDADVISANLDTAVIPTVRRVERTLYWVDALSIGESGFLGCAQEDERLVPWLWGILNGKPVPAGDFLRSLAETAVRADPENYAALRPALIDIAIRFGQYDDPDAVVRISAKADEANAFCRPCGRVTRHRVSGGRLAHCLEHDVPFETRRQVRDRQRRAR